MDFDPWRPDAGAPDAGTWTPQSSASPDAGATPPAQPCTFAAQSSAETTRACADTVTASVAPKPLAHRTAPAHRTPSRAPVAKPAAPVAPAEAVPPTAKRVPERAAAIDGQRWTPGSIALPAASGQGSAHPEVLQTDLEELLDEAAEKGAQGAASR